MPLPATVVKLLSLTSIITKLYLSQAHAVLRQFGGEGVAALGASGSVAPVAVHYGLQDGGEGRHSDAGGD